MACLGVHFSVDESTIRALKAIADDQERLVFLQEEIEADYFAHHPRWLAQTYKAWDYIHRVLTDGQLDWNNGAYPLNHVVMGGERLYSGSGYILTLKTPNQVAAKLHELTDADFRERFMKLDNPHP